MRVFYNQAGTGEPSEYAHYLYDAGGNRVKKIVRKQGGDSVVSVYIDGGFEHLYKRSSGGTKSAEHNELQVMDGRSRIASVRVGTAFGTDTSPAVRYQLEDHLGNASFTLDDQGSLTNREEFFPFGETSFGSYTKKRYRFCGKERDEESGLYYYGARYYMPWQCRFVSVDPLAAEYPFYTPYQYAGNQPVIAIDLDGLEPKFVGDHKHKRRLEQTSRAEDYHRPEPPITPPGYIGPGSIEVDGSGPPTQSVIQNQSFAIYVTFPDETAKIGKHDDSEEAEKIKKNAPDTPLPVQHAGIILGDGETGETYYFDFGRFHGSGYDKDGTGLTRSAKNTKGLTTIDADFDKDGNVSNAPEIVRSLVQGKGQYFAIGHRGKGYGNVEYAVYPNLEFGTMFDFASTNGKKVFTTQADKGTFCAKFANDCIRAGGGEMTVIEDVIKASAQDWEDRFNEMLPSKLTLGPMSKQKRAEVLAPIFRELAKDGPTPSNLAKDIRTRFKDANSNYRPLKTSR
jgi:RHS repeat-associated protein